MKQRLTSEVLIKCYCLIYEILQLIEFCCLAADFTMLLYSQNFAGLPVLLLNVRVYFREMCLPLFRMKSLISSLGCLSSESDVSLSDF